MGAALIPIIAAASRAEREFVEHFRLAGATAPERSIPLPDTGRTTGRRQVERSVRAGVLRPGPGGYWIDEAALARRARTPRRRALLVLIVVALALAALIAGALLGRGGRSPAGLGAARGLGRERVVGPGVPGVASAQVAPHVEVARPPEPREVAGDLHRAVRGGQQV